ncbi:MAG: YitT family protein [Chloroflexi bacterium]|nr:YitT family protein [Chloroflexota bacterium]
MTQKRAISFATIRALFFTYAALTVGGFIGAVAVIIFLSPFLIAPSGVAGVAVILNHQLHTPIGLMVFLLNIPIQILGFVMLPRGWRTVVRTVYLLVIYTLALDVLVPVLPTQGISDNVLLNAIFGGVVGGIGSGIVIRAGGSFGGTSTLALIIQQRTGMPLSSIYLYTDSLVIGAAGLIFGWEAALYAAVALFVDGTTANYVLEGPSVIRTAVIITDKPDAIREVVLNQLHRGMTAWEATGMYTMQPRQVLFVTVARSQVQELRRLVATADPDSFIVIGHGHTAYGEGFQSRKPALDAVLVE